MPHETATNTNRKQNAQNKTATQQNTVAEPGPEHKNGKRKTKTRPKEQERKEQNKNNAKKRNNDISAWSANKQKGINSGVHFRIAWKTVTSKQQQQHNINHQEHTLYGNLLDWLFDQALRWKIAARATARKWTDGGVKRHTEIDTEIHQQINRKNRTVRIDFSGCWEAFYFLKFLLKSIHKYIAF